MDVWQVLGIFCLCSAHFHVLVSIPASTTDSAFATFPDFAPAPVPFPSPVLAPCHIKIEHLKPENYKPENLKTSNLKTSKQKKSADLTACLPELIMNKNGLN